MTKKYIEYIEYNFTFLKSAYMYMCMYIYVYVYIYIYTHITQNVTHGYFIQRIVDF